MSFPENISKNLSCKYSKKFIDHAKQSATDTLKTSSKRAIQKTAEALKTISKRAVQKIAEATGDLIGSEIEDKITRISRTSTQNTLHTVPNKTEDIGFDAKIPKGKQISSEKRQQIIDELRVI